MSNYMNVNRGTEQGFWSDMRIATKAILAVGALAAIILGMGVYSSAWMKRLDESDTLLFEEGAKPLSEVDPVVGTKKRWC